MQQLSQPVFYKKGESGVSAVVGYESASNRVARYSFTAPEKGASAVQLAFSGNYSGSGATPQLAFYIGTDPDSHANAGAGATRTGLLEAANGGRSYSGSAKVVLLPGRTYYVWVFPATTTFGWMTWSRESGAAAVGVSGGATSELTVDGQYLGSDLTLTVTRYGDHSHTITCAVGSRTETVVENSTEQVIPWQPPLELACESPDSDTVAAHFTITTYLDGQNLGSNTCTIPLKLPADQVPSVSCVWQDKGSHRSFYDGLLQGKSVLQTIAFYEGCLGSRVCSTQVLVGGEVYSGGVLEVSGDVELKVTATDSRGRTGEYTEILRVQPYSVPQVTFEALRVDGDGLLDDTGAYARLQVTARLNCPETAQKPSVRLGLAGQTLERFELENGAFTCVVDAPAEQAALYEARVVDSVGSMVRVQTKLSIGYATMDVLAGGKGIAFGTPATEEGFVCAMPARFTAGIRGALEAVESDSYPGCYYRIVDGQTEWYDPPMVQNVEYRTTQRFQGQPVYTKLVSLGQLPNKTSKTVDGVVSGGWKRFLDFHIPENYDTSDVHISGTGDGTWAWLVVKTTTDMSSRTALAVLKYLK